MDSTSPRHCPVHGLVAGRDGRCVICRRDDPDAKEGGSRTILGFALVIAMLVGGGVVARTVLARRSTVASSDAVPPAAPTAPPPRAEDDTTEPTRGDVNEATRAASVAARQRDLEDEMKKVPIRMFAAKDCDLCVTARTFLASKGLAFSEADVGADPVALAALKKLTPNPTVPTFDVDGEVVVGFGPTTVLSAVRRAAERRTSR